MKKSPKSEIDIDHVAQLANLTLTESEKKLFEKQLGEVLGYISKLNQIKTEKVESIGHITGLENISRADEPASSLAQEEVLKNAKKTHNGFFQVEAILDEQ